MPLNQIKKNIHTKLWEVELDKLPEWQRFAIKFLRIFQAVFRDLSDGLPTLRAMSLVYTTLLSIVPLLAVTFSILKGFGLHNEIEPRLIQMLTPLGEQNTSIAKQIVEFVDNIDVGLLGAVGIVFLFYTVITLIHKIESAFNRTWHITEYRALAQRVSDYLSVIMIGPILIFTALAFTAAITSSTLISKLSSIEPFGFIFETTGTLLPYVLVIAAFTVIYLLVPNTRVKFRSALIGAIIAGTLWETTGWIFASFVANSSNYTVVYSSFAILVIFMIWLYLSWLILLIGAAIAYYHQHPDKIPAEQNLSSLSNRMKEKIALLAMYHIAKNFHENKTPWTSSELSDVLNISSEALSDVLHTLECDKLITRHQDRDISYLPGQSLENIFVIRILESIRKHNETTCTKIDFIHSEKVIDTLMTNVDSAIEKSIVQLSLRELITVQDSNQEN
ncbi:MAG: YihY/virulence factor BrkB family protein [Gammaproteobacteria bacterium]|nr:YihY/virulence factor BrkB family protein [Gammaproteobacteria bacterium]MCK5263219.1 YihY/virulence factor BrkB family protein [Gammaproteobacteria bacterium]